MKSIFRLARDIFARPTRSGAFPARAISPARPSSTAAEPLEPRLVLDLEGCLAAWDETQPTITFGFSATFLEVDTGIHDAQPIPDLSFDVEVVTRVGRPDAQNTISQSRPMPRAS